MFKFSKQLENNARVRVKLAMLYPARVLYVRLLFRLMIPLLLAGVSSGADTPGGSSVSQLKKALRATPFRATVCKL